MHPPLRPFADRLRETAQQWDARSLAKVLWAFGRFHFVGREPAVGADALEIMLERLQVRLGRFVCRDATEGPGYDLSLDRCRGPGRK